jgi:hypothetical protein
MVLEAIAVVAIAGSCPSSFQDVNQWGFPDWETVCGEFKYQKCLAAIEEKTMAAAEGAVVRKGSTLYFRILSEDEFSHSFRRRILPTRRDRWSGYVGVLSILGSVSLLLSRASSIQ